MYSHIVALCLCVCLAGGNPIKRDIDMGSLMKVEINVKDLLPPFLQRVFKAKGLDKLLSQKIVGTMGDDDVDLNSGATMPQPATTALKPATTTTAPTLGPPVFIWRTTTTPKQWTIRRQTVVFIGSPLPPRNPETTTPAPISQPPPPTPPETPQPFEIHLAPTTTASSPAPNVGKREEEEDSNKQRLIAELEELLRDE